ncbi:MAG: hypothetical protein ACFCU4_03880 [Puniceicoccaceae bacterium]
MPNRETFKDLISGRKFESYQDGLKSRFRAHRIGYHVTYCDHISKPSITLDFDTDQAVGQVVLWESGECDLEVIDVVTGKDLIREQHVFDSLDSPMSFFNTYTKVPLLLRKIRGDNIPEKES